MSEFKGTPGPWRFEFNNKATKAKVSGKGWGEFARVWILPSRVEGMANARLISAAPDLLEALELAINNFGEDDDEWTDMAHAAIAKALGKDSDQ